jgi:hypothetical protein
MAALSSGGQGDEPANKRARLESVIPAPVAAGKKETAKNQQSTPPPKPCPPPLWLSGQLPAAYLGRGNGRGSGSPHRGGQPTRGGQPGLQAAAGAAEAPTKAANTAAGAAGEGGPPKLSVSDICVIKENKWSNILF